MPEEFDVVEFYCGTANLSRCMAASGYRAAKLDIKFGEKTPTCTKQNVFDILTPGGFASLSWLNQYILFGFLIRFWVC